MTLTKDAPEIEWIREKIKASQYHISEHIVRDFLPEKITIDEIEDAIENGRIIEIHRNPEQGASSLISACSGKKPIHVMCADDHDGWLIILFAYVPSLPVWEDHLTRAKKGDNRMGEKLNKCFFCGGDIKQIKVGNFDYRLEGQLYILKSMPAGLCLQCGEKYITARAVKKINRLIKKKKFLKTEEAFVIDYE